MIFRIAEDVVERRLELVGRRTFGQALLQLFLALVIVSFLAAYFSAIGATILSKMPPGWLGRFDSWWRVIAVFAILGLPALLIAALVWRGILKLSDGWHQLTWDGRAGELIALRRGGLFGNSQTTTIPLDDIRRIDLRASPGGKNLALTLTIFPGRQIERSPLEATVCVRHVDRREEAMDLAFRIGRMCGLTHYKIQRSDLRNLKLHLVRESESDQKFQPLPGSSSSVRYEDDVVSEGVQAPAARVGKFRRQVFEQSVSGTRLIEWQPGQKIQFHQPAPDALTYGFTSAVVAGVAGFIAYHVSPDLKAWLPWWGTMLVAIIAAPLVACLCVWLFNPEREVTFDWTAGRVTWRSGSHSRQAPLSAIESLLLRGLKRTVHRKKQPDYTNYSCRLEMVVEGRTIKILESNTFRELPDAPSERLGPLAAALGESLKVPWQWREYD